MQQRGLEDFAGRWRIARRIANALGPDAVFTGVAEFVPGEGGLIQRESGEMAVEGQAPMRSTRAYLWRQGPAGIEVFFEDGCYFHPIGPGAAPRAHHDCAPDSYRVAYDFSAWPYWSSVWEVTGPRKDYVMETRFSRE